MADCKELDYLDEVEENVKNYFETHRIPDLFYKSLFGEFVKVFGIQPLIPDTSYLAEFDDHGNIIRCDEEKYSYKDQLEITLMMLAGTGGWNLAFKEACVDCDMSWLLDDYNNGDWAYSDVFDGYIVEKMIEVLFTDEDVKTSVGFFKDIKTGIEQAVEYEKGNLAAETITLTND